MKNKEKYAKEIEEISETDRIAIVDGKPQECSKTKCINCERDVEIDVGERRCTDKPLFDWLEEKYVPEVDWTKVPVDTKILVRVDIKEEWKRRYFAKYENSKVFAFDGLGTSWNTEEGLVMPWKYAKLAEESDGKPKSAMELLADSYYAEGKDKIKDDVFEDMTNSCPRDHGYVNMQKCDVGEDDAKLVDCYKCWTLPQPPKES